MRWNQEKDLCFCGISMHFGREMRIRGCSLKIRPISRTWWAVVLDDVLHNVVWHSWIEWEGLVNHLVIAYSPHYDAIWHYDPTQTHRAVQPGSILPHQPSYLVTFLI
jgi:hypothetical protein